MGDNATFMLFVEDLTKEDVVRVTLKKYGFHMDVGKIEKDSLNA